MPLIKNITPVSYSSQDPKHTLHGLLKGSTSWLSASDDKSGKLTADLQLDRASAISYVDVGNFNSVTLSLEVRRSCGGPDLPLLPTVVLMTPQQLRTGHASNKAVRMFKTEDLSQAAVSQKWDRIRLTCSQPFRKDLQFGLAFLRFYTTDAVPVTTTLLLPDPDRLPTATNRGMGANSSRNSVTKSNASLGDFTLEIGSELGTSFGSSNNNITKQKGFLNKSSAASDEDILNRLNPNINKRNQATRKNNVQALAVKRFDRSNLNLSNSFNKRHCSGAVEETIPSPSSSHKDTTPTSDSAATNRQQFLAKLNMNAKTNRTLPTSIQSLEAQRVQGGSGGAESGSGSNSAPQSRTAQLVAAAPVTERPSSARPDSALEAARQQQTEFEYEGLEFLITLDLQLDQLYRLKVSDVRRQLEARRRAPLTAGERIVFRDLALDYCARRIQTLEQDAMKQFANGPNNNCVIDVDSSETVIGQCRKEVRNKDGAAEQRSGGKSIDLRALNPHRNVNVDDSNAQSPQLKPVATRKFSFKRMPDSSNRTPLDDCPSGTGSTSAPNAKKAKFREENPLHCISAASVNRNRLAMSDSNASDFDNPDWSKTSSSSKKQAVSIENKASTPKSNKENKRRPRTPKTPKSATPATNTVGIWLDTNKMTPPAPGPGTAEKPRPHSFSNFDLQMEDPFSDDDVKAVHELDRLMDVRSHQLKNLTSATSSNTAKRKGSSTPGFVTREDPLSYATDATTNNLSSVAGSSSTRNTHDENWLRITRTPNTSVRSPTTPSGRRAGAGQRGGTRSNRGSSTVVVLDSDDDGNSKTSTEVNRTALTSSLMIGSLHNGGNQSNIQLCSSMGNGGDTGFRLGAAPQNKFSLPSNRSSDTQLIDDDDDDTGDGDQVECPICSGFFALSAIESHAAACSSEQMRTAADVTEEDAPDEDSPVHRCPICQELQQEALFEAHVQGCAERNFT